MEFLQKIGMGILRIGASVLAVYAGYTILAAILEYAEKREEKFRWKYSLQVFLVLIFLGIISIVWLV